MQNKPINWPRLVRCSLFQAVVIGTLFIVAAFFATRPQYPYEHKGDTCTSNTYSNNETKERLFGVSAEGWTAIFTAVLAGFTFVLAGVSIIQIDFLTRADKNAAIQTAQLIEQKSIMRDQHFAAHRPKLIFRAIALKQFDIGKHIQINFILANAGETEAIIRQGNATIYIAREGRLPDIPEYDDDRLFLANRRFPGGRKNPLIKIRDIPLLEWEYDCIYGEGRSGEIYFFGFLTYEDGNNNFREIGFCRKFDPAHRRFIAVRDPNYEYED
ncbi:MAG TPA: hypothetical protein VIF02_01830 [Methylocella sp.]|jgi:hypothetical protein